MGSRKLNKPQDIKWTKASEKNPTVEGLYLTYCEKDGEVSQDWWEGGWCYGFPPYDPILHDTTEEITHWAYINKPYPEGKTRE